MDCPGVEEARPLLLGEADYAELLTARHVVRIGGDGGDLSRTRHSSALCSVHRRLER